MARTGSLQGPDATARRWDSGVGGPGGSERTCASEAAQFVDDALERHVDRTGRLLNVLNDVQGAYRYLPEEAIDRIAERMDVPVDQIVRMGEFFGNLSLDPVGCCIIDVCDGTACHTQGASQLVAEFEKKLGITAGQTTNDGAITLRTVGCVGACGIAPVVVVEGDAYGHVRVTQVSDVISLAQKRARDEIENAGNADAAAGEGRNQ